MDDFKYNYTVIISFYSKYKAKHNQNLNNAFIRE